MGGAVAGAKDTETVGDRRRKQTTRAFVDDLLIPSPSVHQS